jgi:site-specific recombinase XerD
MMNAKNELLALKHDFLEYLEKECGRKEKTIENYDHYLNSFFSHAKIKTAKAISYAVVKEYMFWLKKQYFKPKNSQKSPEILTVKTQNYHLIALRGFLKYLHETGIPSFDPKKITLAKTFSSVHEGLSVSEIEMLLRATSGNDIKSVRDNALLHLLFSTGLRVSEVCALNASQDFSKSIISIVGKGGVFREVVLSFEAKDALQTYLKMRIDAGEALFVNNGKRTSCEGETRLSARSVQRIVKFYATKAGIQKKVTPHTLRHTLASNLVHGGVDVHVVQKTLGYAHISSTKVYSETIDENKQKNYKKVSIAKMKH